MIEDTEDRAAWYAHGEQREHEFVRDIAPQLPWGIAMNPAKSSDRTVPDLTLDGSLADLKTQNTPFFKSQQLFGIPPQHAVTFNVKDRDRYRELYPNIRIVYWVNWTDLSRFGISVEPMNRVWLLEPAQLRGALERSSIHWYQRRMTDPRPNAPNSFVIDLSRFGPGIDVRSPARKT